LLEAVLDGEALTDLRAVAATAVVCNYLALSGDGNILILIGTGH